MRITRWAWLAVLVLALVPAALAQEFRGNVYVTVVDPGKQPVPGATVSLAGKDFTRSALTNEHGEARFLRIDPGTYSMTVTFPAFQPASYKRIDVSTGSNVQLTVNMSEALTEEVTVTSANPLLDRRKTGTGTVMTSQELEQVPQVRDPWSVLTTVPGVVTDRVNIGGSESGQQSNFTGKGDNGNNTTWTLDGVSTTDNTASGGSTMYYDFNAFAEIAVDTGGTDFEQTTPGMHINFVQKSGTNDYSGSMRLTRATSGLQSDNTPDEVKREAPILAQSGQAARINKIDETFDKSFDLGGPVVRDAAWFWFGFDKNDINIFKSGNRDNTQLTNWTAKLHGIALGGRATWRAFYAFADKTKQGRSGGNFLAQAVLSPEALWNQTGPNKVYNADVSFAPTPNLQLSLQGDKVESGFTLASIGRGDPVIDANFVQHNATFDNPTDRPVKEAVGRAILTKSTGSWDHELRFGYRYKETTAESQTVYGSHGAYGFVPFGVMYVSTPAAQHIQQNYDTAWIGDTVTHGPLTIVAGVTYSRQSWKWLEVSFPTVSFQGYTIDAVNLPAKDPGVRWNDFLPRLGITYTLPGAHQTLLRASYSRFADQVTGDVAKFGAPSGAISSAFDWSDQGCPGQPQLAGNNQIDPCEWNPANPVGFTTPGSTQTVDRNLKAPLVDEYLVGVEYQLLNDFSVGLTGTYRKRTRTLTNNLILNNQNYFTGLTRADYALFETLSLDVDGKHYDVPVYAPTRLPPGTEDGTVPPSSEYNLPGYYETFKGLELTATKRLSHKWMARAYVAYNDWTRHASSESIVDPTVLAPDFIINGGLASPAGALRSGDFASAYVGSNKWAANINGLYQLPADFTVGANFFARQGYAEPYVYSVRVPLLNGRTITEPVQLGRAEDHRLPTLTDLDLRLTKNIKVHDTTVELALEAFNVLNSNTTLQQYLDARSGSFLFTKEYLSPRVFRFGVAVNF